MKFIVGLVAVFILTASQIAQAVGSLDGEELWSIEEKALVPNSEKGNEPRVGKKKSTDKSAGSRGQGNLPMEYSSRNFARLETTASVTVLPAASLKSTLDKLHVGETLTALIHHSIIAFPDEVAPVVAEVAAGPLEGYRLLGESRLEKNSKRIFIDFKRIAHKRDVFVLRASGLSRDGQPGFQGEYHSREAAYFAGDFIASLTAAYFDGLVPRSTNVFGQVQADNSVDSALKNGLAGGAMATADRFKEKLKRVPEFSELRGPLSVQILILENAIEL